MQLVKYKWTTSGMSGEPFLFARSSGELVKMKLFDGQLRVKIGKRHCTGYMKGRKHFECPESRLVCEEKTCRECALNDDFFLCMKCTGAECINENQRPSCMENNYYIYLAAFGSILKVGVSYEHRILERLIEQGADMGAKICKVQDGKLARSVEQKIRAELNICDRVTGAEKQRMLFGSINVAAMNISSACTRLRSNGLAPARGTEIYNFQGVYRLASITSVPRAVYADEGSVISGDVIAAKGNIMVLKNESGLLSVNAHRLVGCDVELLD